MSASGPPSSTSDAARQSRTCNVCGSDRAWFGVGLLKGTVWFCAAHRDAAAALFAPANHAKTSAHDREGTRNKHSGTDTMTVPVVRLADLDASWRAVAERVTAGRDVDHWRWFLSPKDQAALLYGRGEGSYATAQQREPESGRVVLLAKQLQARSRR